MKTIIWAERALFAGAVGLLGYCGYVLVDTLLFQNRERRQFEGQIGTPPVSAAAFAITNGGLLGKLEIPRLGVSAIVIEGTSRETLQRAVGHIAGTALPGAQGNVGISGHRDTFFRPLRDIHRGDVITLTTLAGKFEYRVVSTRTVDPSETWVLDSGDGESLTLVTCFPFYFVGPAPDRFIVRAERTTS